MIRICYIDYYVASRKFVSGVRIFSAHKKRAVKNDSSFCIFIRFFLLFVFFVFDYESVSAYIEIYALYRVSEKQFKKFEYIIPFIF